MSSQQSSVKAAQLWEEKKEETLAMGPARTARVKCVSTFQ